MFQPKDTDWLNGNKKQTKKTPIYAVYKKRPLYMLSTRDPPQT